MDEGREVNILLVEDDTDIINMFKRICDKDGFKLQIPPTLEAGYDLSLNMTFNLVIFCLKPDYNIAEVMAKFRQRNPLACYIVVKSQATLDSIIEAMRQGVVDYLRKPFGEDELRQVMIRALKHQKQESAKQRLMEEAIHKEYYQRLSIIDGLTGAYNYRYFNKMLSHEMARARRYPQEFSLLIIDVDEFKNYNDTKGHLEGDKMLREIAEFFIQAIRAVDLVFRYGGEEFAILLPQTPKDGAVAAAKRIMTMFRKQISITISIGVASFPEDAQTEQDLVKNSDHALYQAKFLGKDRICVFGRNGSIKN